MKKKLTNKQAAIESIKTARMQVSEDGILFVQGQPMATFTKKKVRNPVKNSVKMCKESSKPSSKLAGNTF